MTTAANVRYFHELAQREVDRARRYNRPLTLVYIDLDNFKEVNDRFGHGTGDEVLRRVGRVLQRHVRATDIVARMGGDEFALLMPETAAETARSVVPHVRAGLLKEMQKKGWPVTFSIGAVTYEAAPATVDDMIRGADDLMYSVKASTKNSARYAIHGRPDRGSPHV